VIPLHYLYFESVRTIVLQLRDNTLVSTKLLHQTKIIFSIEKDVLLLLKQL